MWRLSCLAKERGLIIAHLTILSLGLAKILETIVITPSWLLPTNNLLCYFWGIIDHGTASIMAYFSKVPAIFRGCWQGSNQAYFYDAIFYDRWGCWQRVQKILSFAYIMKNCGNDNWFWMCQKMKVIFLWLANHYYYDDSHDGSESIALGFSPLRSVVLKPRLYYLEWKVIIVVLLPLTTYFSSPFCPRC